MNPLNLHISTPNKLSTTINRVHVVLHLMAIMAMIYYRASSLKMLRLPLPYYLVFASELLLSLLWLLHQAYLWRPVLRKTFPERLDSEELPAIDVFICTADSKKEPVVEVMNTVLSAMALDYPPEKLHVYLSDDGGSYMTLLGMREACVFAKYWLPFCRKFGIKTRCPKVYFSSLNDDLGHYQSTEYEEEKQNIKRKYEAFVERLNRTGEKGETAETKTASSKDHLPFIEVISDKSDRELVTGKSELALLVYVSREKRPSCPHHFKAGALNVLLRVSSIISNSPYVLVLDCDMHCNDTISARRAMCFHLDSELSPSLAFVQFPQKFHNISKSDIYDAQLRSVYMTKWPGMDGLQGPMLSGTGFYMKRTALYGNVSQDVLQLKKCFGPSNELIKSVQHSKQKNMIKTRNLHGRLQEEAQFLATCSYEEHTQWGQQIGFLYNSVLEDYFTGYLLHCKGWNSVFCDPSTPAFLGTGTTKLNDTLVQGTRWNSGALDVTFSRFSPLIHGVTRMPVLQSACYVYLSLQPFYFIPLWCLAILYPFCLLNGIPLYPKVSNSWFITFAYIFLASHLKHLQEVFSTGGSILTWWNEQRFWIIKAVTAYALGSLDAILKSLGIREANFLPTNKVADDQQIALYQMGKFNFQTSITYLAPLVTLAILNAVSVIGGVARVAIWGSWNEMFGQVFLSFYFLALTYPIIEGMLLREDKGRVPPSVSLLCLLISIIFLYFGSFLFM